MDDNDEVLIVQSSVVPPYILDGLYGEDEATACVLACFKHEHGTTLSEFLAFLQRSSQLSREYRWQIGEGRANSIRALDSALLSGYVSSSSESFVKHYYLTEQGLRILEYRGNLAQRLRRFEDNHRHFIPLVSRFYSYFMKQRVCSAFSARISVEQFIRECPTRAFHLLQTNPLSIQKNSPRLMEAMKPLSKPAQSDVFASYTVRKRIGWCGDTASSTVSSCDSSIILCTESEGRRKRRLIERPHCIVYECNRVNHTCIECHRQYRSAHIDANILRCCTSYGSSSHHQQYESFSNHTSTHLLCQICLRSINLLSDSYVTRAFTH